MTFPGALRIKEMMERGFYATQYVIYFGRYVVVSHFNPPDIKYKPCTFSPQQPPTTPPVT